MYIKCWGTRGSIPVSGQEYVRYGGDTTCIEIRTKNDRIIVIDAGTGIRRLGKHLVQEGRRDVDLIFTHSHWDHLMGFPFFGPVYGEGSDIRIHGCPFAEQYVEDMLTRVMSPPNFPVRLADVRAKISFEKGCPEHLRIDSVVVIPIRLSHPNQGNGYKFIEDGKTFVFITDNELGFVHPGGLSFEAYREFAQGADLLFHDSEYTAEEYKTHSGWGHSSYLDALELALQANVKHFGLFHLNQDRTDREMDRIVEDCRRIIKKRGGGPVCFGIYCDMTFTL